MKSLLAVVAAFTLTANAECIIPYWTLGQSFTHAASFLVSADFDGDGKPDVAGSTPTSIFVMHNSGAGQFTAPADIYQGTIKTSILAADFDGNHTIDLAFAGSTSLIVLPGKGDGTFGAAIESPITIAPSQMIAATIDSNASLDLVAGDSSAFVVFANDGSGKFHELSRTSTGDEVPSLAAGDLDLDGRTDIVVPHSTTSGVFYGHGDGTFDAQQSVGAAAGGWDLNVADMDHDGWPDIVSINSGGWFAVRHNNGKRTFGAMGQHTTQLGTQIQGLQTQDLTGDPYPDAFGANACELLTWTHADALDSYYRWSRRFDNCTLYNPIVPPVLASADFDGDHRNDVAVAYTEMTSAGNRIIKIMQNRCGDNSWKLTSDTTNVLAGQTVNLRFEFVKIAGEYSYMCPNAKWTLKDGDTIVATYDAPCTYMTAAVAIRTPGDHRLTAMYEGDDQYAPSSSNTVVVHATAPPRRRAAGR